MSEEIRNFQLGELIATGGMAAIYKGTQISLNRPVAIKILHSHLARDENFIVRFEREAKSAAALQHENIIGVIDFGKEEDKYFLAMEFVDGPSLKEIIEQGPVPIEVVLYILTEVLHGISYAHQSGVIHRDLKPGNILVDKRGSVKIGDFGLAKAQDTATVTVTGSIVGTPAYMSPEQASGATVDHRSDLFSIGVMAYEMITGKKPFPGETYSMVINSLLSKEPKPISDFLDHIPKRLESIVQKLLKKDPDQRYQDAQDIISEIDQLCQDTTIVRDKKNLISFVKAKEHYLKEIRRKHIDAFYNRGLHFVNLGMGKIDNAIDQFSLVLLLDPENEDARRMYEDLKKKKDGQEEKVVREEKKVVEKKKVVAEKKTPVRERPVKKKRSLLIPIVIISVILAVLIGVFFIYTNLGWLIGGLKPSKFANVYIKTDPKGALIMVDSVEYRDPTPLRIDSVATGDHLVSVSLEGYKPVSFEERIERNETLFYELTPYPGVLDISIPDGSRLEIDGVQFQPGLITLDPGSHNITVTGPSVNYKKTIAFEPAETLKIDVSKKVETAYITIRSVPSASLMIDGQNYGFTPKSSIKMKPGSHIVVLKKGGFAPIRRIIRVKAGERKTYNYQLRPIRKIRRTK